MGGLSTARTRWFCGAVLATGAFVGAASGCGDDPIGASDEAALTDRDCTSDEVCADLPAQPVCDSHARKCLPRGHEIGWGDGTAASVDLTVVLSTSRLRGPTDLAFNPDDPSRLWVVNYDDDSVVIVEDAEDVGAATGGAAFEHRRDPAASHFMPNPPAIAFGATDPEWGPTFAACADANNHHNNPGAPHFMGPALFSADLDVFAEETPDGLGSHLDMLHSTSYCRGIEHFTDSVYFVFNAQKRSIDKYDFHDDHGPGMDDHSDGEIWRYVTDQVKGRNGYVSHLAYAKDDRRLYVADTGNRRIVALDTTSGELGSAFAGQEEIVSRYRIDDAILEEIVPSGTLAAPSGIEVRGDLVYVSDADTSLFHVFDRQGVLLRSLDTGLPAGSLAGFTFGPESGKLYFVDREGGRVLRIDPRP